MSNIDEYEFVVKKAEPKTAKDRFLKQVASKDCGYFSKSVYETVENLKSFDGHGSIEDLKSSGLSESWYTLTCYVCGNASDKLVSFDVNGGEYDYDICADCLRGALIALARKQ